MVVTAGNEGRKTIFAHKLTGIVDFAVRSHLRAVAVLLVVALLGFLPGFFSLLAISRFLTTARGGAPPGLHSGVVAIRSLMPHLGGYQKLIECGCGR